MNELESTLALTGSGRLRRDTRLVFALLEKIRGGLLEVRLPDGARFLFGEGEPGVTMQVNDEAVFARVLAKGDIGLPKPTSTASGIRPMSPRCLRFSRAIGTPCATRSMARGDSSWRLACATGSTATAAPAARATSWRITTWATTSIGCGSIPG